MAMKEEQTKENKKDTATTHATNAQEIAWGERVARSLQDPRRVEGRGKDR